MSQASAAESLYLVDAHSLIFQVFHGIKGMTSPTGVPTNAVFGFLRDMLFLRGLRPTYLICAFDRSEPTFRSDLYADYKAHRSPMPEDLSLQIPLIQEALGGLGIPVLSHPRYEADDILATLAVAADKRGIETFICTSDKDCRQLITDRVRMFNLRKREEFGRAELLADWGIAPEQVVDLQTLVGDSVDNVPGVAGIGYKTAAKLLQDFGTLENILANIDKIPGAKKQESLRACGDIVKLSRSLVKLADDVPIELTWDEWMVRPVDTEALTQRCREWGFNSLAGQVRAVGRVGLPEPVAQARETVTLARASGSEKAPPRQTEMFADTEEELFPFGANVAVESPPSAFDGATYTLIDTPEKFALVLTALCAQPRFAIDLETTSLTHLDAEIVGIALSWSPGEAYYLALRGPKGSALLDSKDTVEQLRPLLEDPKQAKVNQNIKYDFLVFRARGVEVRGIAGDCMIADYLLHSGERSHGLEELARRYFGYQVIPITDLIGKKKPKQPQLRMDQVPTDKIARYAGEDADVAWRLCELLEGKLGADGALRHLYDDLEIPLIEVLAEMEHNGIRLDVPLLKRLGEEMQIQLEGIEKEIYALAGHEFNIGSLPQLRKVLFDDLKLPVQKRTGITGEPSTDQESLEKLAALNQPGAALPRKIVEYRQISKLKGTYVDALPLVVHTKTGRIHASFNQTVAATGRLSSSDPNLQNIPARREMGQQIRRAFLPEPGWTLLTADYSQIELRLLAHFCADDELARAFAEDRDIHSAVAAQIFGVPEAEVSDSQRGMAKTVNFGILYGMSPVGLAQRLHIDKGEAADFIKAYFARYPRVEAYQTKLLRDCIATGYVPTILGRRRQFDVTAIRAHSTYQSRNGAEREAINMEIQGSAADLIKLAMLAVFRRLRADRMKARLLLQIHDELVFECPPEELPRLAALVRHEMIGPVAERLGLRVPLRVDLASGPNWLEVEAL